MVFIDANEDSIMVNDVVMPLNPPIVPIEKEKLEKTLFDMNISQWSCKEEPFKRVVRTRIDHSAWDYQLFLNPHALTIYLKFVPACGATP